MVTPHSRYACCWFRWQVVPDSHVGTFQIRDLEHEFTIHLSITLRANSFPAFIRWSSSHVFYVKYLQLFPVMIKSYSDYILQSNFKSHSMLHYLSFYWIPLVIQLDDKITGSWIPMCVYSMCCKDVKICICWSSMHSLHIQLVNRDYLLSHILDSHNFLSCKASLSEMLVEQHPCSCLNLG